MKTERRKALEYVLNTAGNATIAHFDDDHEPIGLLLRKDIIPRHATVNDAGFLDLTEAGRAELEAR